MAKTRDRKTATTSQSKGEAAPIMNEQVVGKAKIVRANLNRTVVESPAFVSIYTNDIQVQTTPWDLRLLLGQIHEIATGDNPTVTVKLLGELRMSPQFAKKVAMILIEQLESYEQRIGPIPLPTD